MFLTISAIACAAIYRIEEPNTSAPGYAGLTVDSLLGKNAKRNDLSLNRVELREC